LLLLVVVRIGMQVIVVRLSHLGFSLSTDIAKVGGSIAGLMIARVLKECGNDVKIIEKNKRLHSPAGISLGRNAVELLERFFPHSMPRSIENTGMVHFDTDGNITSIEPLPRAAEGIRTSSWNEVHQCLRRHIETGGRHWITGSVVVAEGTRVTEVVQEGESLAVRYVDQYGAYGKEHADLVVAADGAYSFVRQLSDEQMPPMGNCDKVRLPQYSECVAWRKGMCDEDDLPHRNLRAIVEGKIGFYAIPDKRAYFIL
jgi:2-polyprenyl-6-methoxyphenol hydroxylase-like FAD-dependent oxidoreductase